MVLLMQLRDRMFHIRCHSICVHRNNQHHLNILVRISCCWRQLDNVRVLLLNDRHHGILLFRRLLLVLLSNDCQVDTVLLGMDQRSDIARSLGHRRMPPCRMDNGLNRTRPLPRRMDPLIHSCCQRQSRYSLFEEIIY